MLNLWSFNFLKEHHKECIACQTYSQRVVEILKEQWKPIYGDFDYVIDKIIKTDRSFIDLSKISTSRKWEILDLLIVKKQEKNELIISKKFLKKYNLII